MGFPSTPLRGAARTLIVAGLLQELIFIGLVNLADLRQEIPLFLLLYFASFLTYLKAARAAGQVSDDHATSTDMLAIMFFFAVLFRLTLFLSQPTLSEDVYRYVWDGKLLNTGINPYQYPPGAQELIQLRDPLYLKINHKDIGTPYGPVAIMTFALSQRVLNSVYMMKIPFIVFDLVSMYFIFRILEVIGEPKSRLLIYAWHPLVLVEIAGSGHNDSAAILCVLASLYWLLRSRYYAASLAITMAFLAKYLAAILLPLIWRNFKRFEWLVFPITVAVFFAPFYQYLDHHAVSLVTVGASWRFNDSLFSVIYFLTGSLVVAKVAVAMSFVLLIGLVVVRGWPVLKGAMILIGGALLLTTTVQPWYLVWIVPFLCFYRNRAWLLLTALVVLAYHVLILYQAEGIWRESVWIKTAIYAPFYVLLVGDWAKQIWDRRARRLLPTRSDIRRDP